MSKVYMARFRSGMSASSLRFEAEVGFVSSLGMNLASAFAASANKHPKKIALYWGEDEYSYGKLWEQTVAFAGKLCQEFKVKRGDRVGLWLKNCPQFVPAFFGILQVGGGVGPHNNFLKPAEVIYMLQDAGIDVLITDNELGAHFPVLAAARPSLRLGRAEELNKLNELSREKQGHASKGSQLAVIIYTSGTTGRPKGAMLSHANLLHNVESCRLILKVGHTDRIVVLLPMFHSYMLTVGILLPLLIGGSIILVKSLHPLRNTMQEICERKATVLPAIPQFYRGLVHAHLSGPLPFRMCISGAAPLPGQILKEFEEKFHIPLIEGYGLSEASPVDRKRT